MIKHIVFLIILSVVALFFKVELGHVLSWVSALHNAISNGLAMIFTHGTIGQLVQDTIALIIIPLCVGGILALLYYLVKRSGMPHAMTTIWMVWLIVLITILAPHVNS